MLIGITRFGDINARKLMDVYAESNLENTDFFYPGETDKEAAVRKVEEGFLDFLKNEFFAREGSVYWILEEDGAWVSALRTSLISRGLYYIEALETRPDRRQRGFAVRLLTSVAEELKKDGPFRLCSCVYKKNSASLRTHLKSGFSIASEEGFDYLRGESDSRDFGLEYRYR